MAAAITIALVVIPTFLLLGYFRARDLNPEPARMLWKTFGYGVLICLLVAPVEFVIMWAISPLSSSPYLHGFAEALFGAAIPEESFKMLVLVLVCMRSREFDEPMDGIVYGAVASLGFATFENIGYVLGDDHSLRVALFRALTAVPGHAFMGAIMGYYAGQARFGRADARVSNWITAFAAPVALHALYDFPPLTARTLAKLQHETPSAGALSLLTIGVLILEWRITVRLVRSLRVVQIEEVRDIVGAVAAEIGADDILKAMDRPDPLPRATPGWVMAIIGGCLAIGGGLLCLLLAVGLATSSMPDDEMKNAIAGALILGGAPLIAGFVVFVMGAKRIHASRPEAPPVIAARSLA